MALTVLEALAPVCGEVCLVRRGPPDGMPWRGVDGHRVQVIRDAGGESEHPLWGVVSALTWTKTEAVVIVPCDVPDLPTEGLQRLVEAAEPPGVVAWDGERAHPLVAVVWTSQLERARTLAQQERSVREFAEPLSRVALPSSWLQNINVWSPSVFDAPLMTLRRRLAWLERAALERVLDGERTRLAQRGVLDPTDGHPVGRVGQSR